MQAARTIAAMAAVLVLSLMASSCDRAAHAEVNPGDGKVVEILDNPDVLLTNKPAAELSLNGVKLGDPISAIPENIIKFRHDNRFDCTNAAYTIVNGQVWSMTLTDRQKLSQLLAPQDEPELIQMRLGKADEIETPDGEIKNSWKGYWFSSKRSAQCISDENFTGWVSVTVSR